MEKTAKTTGQRRDKKRWPIVAVGLVVAAGVLTLVAANMNNGAPSSDNSLNVFTVRSDDLLVTVTESGNIKARNPINLKSEVEGRSTIISIVPEGTYVTQQDIDEGMVLCELDSGDLDEDLVQRKISFANAEASYLQALEAYAIQLKQNESDIAADRLDVKFALMDFQKYIGEDAANKIMARAEVLNDPNVDIATIVDVDTLLADINNLGGAASQSLGELQDSILLTRAKYKRADNQLTWTKKLREKEYVSETELESDQLDVQSLNIQVGHSETELELYQRYDFSKQTQKFLSDYFEANRKLERTYALARSRVAQAQAKLESTKAELELRENRLEKTKRQLVVCKIKSPEPGLVVYGSSGDESRRFRGSGIIEAGETVYQRQTVITLLPDSSEMMTEMGVHESSVDKVKPGQRATIIVEAFPDRKFYGEVLNVAPLPDQQRGWLSPDIKVYETQVSIEGKYESLKPGMNTRVEILVDNLTDVVTVPVEVVANRGGRKICYVVNGSGTEQREVKTGQFNDTYVEIVSGLETGEQVLMNPPRITESEERAIADKAIQEETDTPPRARDAQARQETPGAETASAAERPGERRGLAQQGEVSEDERAKRMQEFQNMSEEERAQRRQELRGSGGPGSPSPAGAGTNRRTGGGGGRNRGGENR